MASSHPTPPPHGGGPPSGGSALVQVKPLHAPDILKLPMPTPKDVGAFTEPSLPGATGAHSQYLWRGNVAPWTDFEQEVEKVGTQGPPVSLSLILRYPMQKSNRVQVLSCEQGNTHCICSAIRLDIFRT